MATFKQTQFGWQAQVSKNGVRKAKTFPSKKMAADWAATLEADIIALKYGVTINKTFGEMLERYKDTHAAKHRGASFEMRRLSAFMRSPLASVKLEDLTPEMFANWRDERLKTCTPNTVLREWGILSAAFRVAIDEWEWLKVSPLKKLKRPAKGPDRDRLVDPMEKLALMLCSGYTVGDPIQTLTAKSVACFLLGCETAMRKGEILGLRWEDIDLTKRVAKVRGVVLGGGKTQAAVRGVPLSTQAVAILKDFGPKRYGAVVDMSPEQLDSLFRKVRSRCDIENLHFHDSRHEAITQLSKQLNVLELARSVGHRDIKMLQVYYNAPAEELASKLE